jgi:DNA-binding beta-propeller fold protein YncE
LAALDPGTLRVTRQIDLAGHPESFQLDRAGMNIYVNVPSAGHIAVVDRASGAVTATWALSGAARNYAMALDEDSHRLFVATRQPPMLLAYDLRTGKAVDRVPVCGDVDDLFVDRARQRLYLICGEGFVEVVHTRDGALLTVAERVATAPGARTGLFVPELSALFVAVPARGGSIAEIRAFKLK